MSYATRQDYITAFDLAEMVQLCDRDGDGQEDAGVLDDELQKSSAIVDSYIGQLYQLPLATTPPLLTAVCCDIARYRLFKDRAPETVRDRYKDATRWLEGVRDGKNSLGLATVPAGSGVDPVEYSAADRVFTRSSLADY